MPTRHQRSHQSAYYILAYLTISLTYNFILSPYTPYNKKSQSGQIFPLSVWFHQISLNYSILLSPGQARYRGRIGQESQLHTDLVDAVCCLDWLTLSLCPLSAGQSSRRPQPAAAPLSSVRPLVWLSEPLCPSWPSAIVFVARPSSDAFWAWRALRVLIGWELWARLCVLRTRTRCGSSRIWSDAFWLVKRFATSPWPAVLTAWPRVVPAAAAGARRLVRC